MARKVKVILTPEMVKNSIKTILKIKDTSKDVEGVGERLLEIYEELDQVVDTLFKAKALDTETMGAELAKLLAVEVIHDFTGVEDKEEA